MISISNISKSFGKKNEICALNDISLHVSKGELFGLIGPDGAGKTTLFRILTSLMIPDSGKASVAGFDVVSDYRNLRKILGYMPGKFSLYQDLTVAENLQFYASIFNTSIEENYHLIKDIYIHLEPFKTRKAGALSGGMKQKLALCCALIHKPKVLFLDEPTTGVDVVSRKEFWQMLQKLKNEDITIFVSTPYMDEAAKCDHIALIQNGKILSTNTPEGMIHNFNYVMMAIKTDQMNKARFDLLHSQAILDCYSFGEFLHVKLSKVSQNPPYFVNFLNTKGHQNIEVKIIAPTIEDCFMDLMDTPQNN
ncbi:MAG: ABC transporter ATP-binding protein [Saprospiraceae bacterium]|nr:ABC transporter ATP-binding protein [Saprospiraceae bacterium]